LIYVGYYLAGVGAVTLVALLLIREGQRSGHGAGHP
jgi:hypothetical protein